MPGTGILIKRLSKIIYIRKTHMLACLMNKQEQVQHVYLQTQRLNKVYQTGWLYFSSNVLIK